MESGGRRAQKGVKRGGEEVPMGLKFEQLRLLTCLCMHRYTPKKKFPYATNQEPLSRNKRPTFGIGFLTNSTVECIPYKLKKYFCAISEEAFPSKLASSTLRRDRGGRGDREEIAEKWLFYLLLTQKEADNNWKIGKSICRKR